MKITDSGLLRRKRRMKGKRENMANKFCSGCGNPLRPDMVICPNCGKLAGQSAPASHPGNSRVGTTPRQGAVHKQGPVQPRQSRPVRQAAPAAAVCAEEEEQSVKPRGKKKKIIGLVFRLATVAVVLTALYIAIFAIQVFRVKISDYDFDNEMKMSRKNFGEAIDGYFESGKWSVNPFTGTCTYKGETRHSEEYEIVFSARLKVDVDKIYVDGEEVEEKQIETRIMGMFI